MPQDVVVVGAGMITAVGLSAVETAASVRAGTARFAESPWVDRAGEPFVTSFVLEDGLPGIREGLEAAPLSGREVRLLRLATMPLLEAFAGTESVRGSVGLLLALPETDTRPPVNRVEFLTWLAQQTEHTFDVARSHCASAGRAGGLIAIGTGIDLIRRGDVKVIVAGGIDSYYDLDILDRLDREQRVKSATTLDGFIPGEGGAFLLLADRRTATSAGLAPWAVLSAVSHAVEPGHLYSEEPYLGQGLALAVQQLLESGAMTGPIQEVYSSMNGESHWAKEWAVARIRHNNTFADDHGVHHPADCFGDTGAACGPLLVGLAALGIKDGYYRSPALVYASSDHGARAAVAVAAA